jgi:transposase-like protein
MGKKTKTYTPLPALGPEVAARYRTVLEVLSGALTVSEGARRLGLSRNHFQSLMHRAMGSMVEELTPTAGGRPPTPEAERRLREENERLLAENQRLRQRVETTDHILSVASGLLKGRLAHGRSRESRGANKPTEDE